MFLTKGTIFIVQGLSNHMSLMLLIPIENIQKVSEEFITCPTATRARRGVRHAREMTSLFFL